MRELTKCVAMLNCSWEIGLVMLAPNPVALEPKNKWSNMPVQLFTVNVPSQVLASLAAACRTLLPLPKSNDEVSPNGGAIAFIDAPEGYEIELIQRGAK